jgi:hypothetical protein
MRGIQWGVNKTIPFRSVKLRSSLYRVLGIGRLVTMRLLLTHMLQQRAVTKRVRTLKLRIE